ncbi:MAG: FtsW/RodA/SpoVE family cell cycle protein [Eubacteriales bacterium]|nr:FtsW/RodA/SpoVE family cell cycle protein [Eubacteriales bacterium]
MFSRIVAFFKGLREGKFDRSLMRFFDWPLFLNVLAISLFGVVTIFSATSSAVTEKPATIMEMLRTQSLTYPRLQLIWIIVGVIAMFVIIFFNYELYGKYANTLYVINLLMLLIVLGMEAGRGGMSAFINWGNDRGFQPSELGKVIMIICFAKAFSVRMKPVMRMRDVMPLVLFMALPLVLILAQPDVGTALVYMAVFCVMVWVSGTNWKLIASVVVCAVLIFIPVWYFLNNSSSDNFRLTRIWIWLDPESYPDEARQVINGQIALGSGGLFGKGLVSPGSFASLGYISDDHTDFIFSIVGESFGLVGSCLLVLGYILLLGRLLYQSMRIEDPFGSYVVVGVFAMMLFHVVENIGMVIGLLPVTGIPLPFMSYGGSNMLTNMMAIGLAENVIMRARKKESHRRVGNVRVRKL